MSYMHTGPDLGGGAEAWPHQKSAWWGGEVFPCTEKCLEKVTQKALKIKYFSVKSEEKNCGGPNLLSTHKNLNFWKSEFEITFNF